MHQTCSTVCTARYASLTRCASLLIAAADKHRHGHITAFPDPLALPCRCIQAQSVQCPAPSQLIKCAISSAALFQSELGSTVGFIAYMQKHDLSCFHSVQSCITSTPGVQPPCAELSTRLGGRSGRAATAVWQAVHAGQAAHQAAPHWASSAAVQYHDPPAGPAGSLPPVEALWP